MDWTPEEPATCFRSNGQVNRKAELKKRLETVTVSGKKSKLVRLDIESVTSAKAYALFEEEMSGKIWAAVILTKTPVQTTMSYALIPEWENPPHCQCSELFLEKLEELGPSEHPNAEKWRMKCRKKCSKRRGKTRRAPSKLPTAFEKMIEGTRIIWTVGDGAPAYLPKGKQIILEKAKVRRTWHWRDIESGALYSDEMIPESDRQVLKGR